MEILTHLEWNITRRSNRIARAICLKKCNTVINKEDNEHNKAAESGAVHFSSITGKILFQRKSRFFMVKKNHSAQKELHSKGLILMLFGISSRDVKYGKASNLR